jgi:hypothetical protein
VKPNSDESGTAETADPPEMSAAASAAAAETPPPAETVLPAKAPRPADPPPVRSSAPIAGTVRAVAATDPLTTAITVGLGLTNVIQLALLLTVSTLTAVPPGPFTPTPTLRLNGFDIVPTSTEEVTSMYGRLSYLPGTPGLIQGRQTFGVVDPKTGEQVGSFDALVARGNGIGYTQLLVTSSEGAGVGTAAGPVPPVGSMISNLQLGPIGFFYSALSAPSGSVVSFKITTPLGNIAVPIPFDYAKGIADRTVDNRPMHLGNGYSIAPADPNGETITAITGLLPGFMTVQGNQVFSVYDSTGHPVGQFEGVFTTTSDLYFYTQAVMVTANDGTDVGTGAGQIPPVGSVYNVIYFGTDDHFLLYSSLPAPGGTEVSTIRVNKGNVTRSAVSLIDASTPPTDSALVGAGGFRFIPVSELRPSGINGLPPREVEIQGYQQFDVLDSTGVRIGTVDADVFIQWDAFNIRSKALLITRVTEGGSDVPPAGSIFNFVRSGDNGFGTTHSTVPWASGNQTSVRLRTPVGDVGLPSTFVPAPSRTPVSFYSPFRV